MPKTQAEQKEWRQQAYGFDDIDDYIGQIKNAHKWDSDLNALINGAVSTLSDAQHLLELYPDDPNRVRQMMNIAKAVLFKARIEDRGKTPDEYAAAVKDLTDLPKL